MGSGKKSGENQYKTLVGQLASILEMVMSGKRKLPEVTKFLQILIAKEDFITMLDAPQVAAQIVAKTVENKLLNMVSAVEMPATAESFLASERFVENTEATAWVKIYAVGGNFNSWFGNMLVDASQGSTLACHILKRDAYDREILSALGGEAKCETTLAELWQLMSRQGQGESGALLSDGKANIFYIRDSSSVLRAVRVYWGGDGWDVDAGGLGYGSWYWRWLRGRRVFVRNS